MIKKLSIILVCILFPVIAEGADWVKVSESEDSKVTYYVDVSSIKKISPNQYKVWYKADVNNDKEIKKILYLSIVDCAERKEKYLQTDVYAPDGSSVTGEEQDWIYVTPETNVENVLNFVCTYKKGVLNIPKRDK